LKYEPQIYAGIITEMFSPDNNEKIKQTSKDLGKLVTDLTNLKKIMGTEFAGIVLIDKGFSPAKDKEGVELLTSDEFDKYSKTNFPLNLLSSISIVTNKTDAAGSKGVLTAPTNSSESSVFFNTAKNKLTDAISGIGNTLSELNKDFQAYQLRANNYQLTRVYNFLKRITDAKYKPDESFNKIDKELKDALAHIKSTQEELVKSIDQTIGLANEVLVILKNKGETFRFEVTSKVFPTPFTNSKGFRIGDYKVAVRQDLLPFSAFDQANHYLYNLFDYATYQGTPKVNRKQERDIDSFFKSKNTQLEAFTPIKYPDPEKAKMLSIEKEQIKEQNRKLRENLRKIQDELVEIGFSGDLGKRDEIRKKIEEEIEKDGGDKKESILAEYLSAIDDLENGSRGFVPPFLTALTKGGTKRSRKPRRKCKKSKKHRITRRK